ncbi:MAG: (Fe-S)-binding protein [Spirosomataceae bacterium]
MKVSLFVPCYIDQFYPQVAIATLELLEKLGCEVHFPMNQTCCGQPMANSGFAALAQDCDRNFVQNFADADYIVAPSGSCVLHVKEHVPITPKGGVYELCEFLTDVLQVKSLKARFPYKVGLHQSCHGQRGLRLASMSERNEAPFSKIESLLAMVEGLELCQPQRSDECCGFGGTFCVTEEAVSVKMGKDRVKEHLDNQVEYITGADSSCLMHLEGILRRQQSPVKAIHVAEILNAL